MHKTFSDPPGTEFGGTGYPITRANLAIVFPYGVPGSYSARDVLDKLRGRKSRGGEPKLSHVARVLRLLGRTSDEPTEETTERPKKAQKQRKRKEATQTFGG